MSIADQLIERELREMAVTPKQQEVLDLIRRHKAPVYVTTPYYGGAKGRDTTNYEMRGWSAVSDSHISKRLPTRLVGELIKNKALEFIKADDNYGSWTAAFIPAGDDPADYGITVWNK